MDNPEKKQIIIIGGLGVTGQLIASDLVKHASQNIQVTVASRHPDAHAPGLPESVSRAYIDIDKQDEAIKILSKYDFAIIATGPFYKYGMKPFLVCIGAGVDCLDVNDDYKTMSDLYALEDKVNKSGVRVFTGMGLNPGLSTFLLLSLFKDTDSAIDKNIHLTLFIGAKQLSGYAAIDVVLDGFADKEVPFWKDGHIKQLSVKKESGLQPIDFQNNYPPAKTFFCPTPHILSFQKNKTFSAQNINEMFFSLCFESMDSKMVNFIRNNKWIRSKFLRPLLKNMIYKSQQKNINSKQFTEETIALAKCTLPHAVKEYYCRGLSSYEMTARFAGLMTQYICSGKKQKQGIYCLEDLPGADFNRINEELIKRGFKFNEKHYDKK